MKLLLPVRRTPALAWAAIVALLVLSQSLPAQKTAPATAAPAPATGISTADYYPSQQKKTLITGDEATPGTGDTYLIKGLKIQSFRETSGAESLLEMTALAPSCSLDIKRGVAMSEGPLKIESADGRMLIQGNGFSWQKIGTNSTLTISNNVETTLRKDLLSQSATNVNPASTETPTGTNQFLHIHAQRFSFDRDANLITYSGHVTVDDSQMQLTCDLLTIQRMTNGSINNIAADNNVVIVNKSTGGQTTGDHAVYAATDGRQLVTLTGHPHWQDGGKEGTARGFVFDRGLNTLLADGDAYLKLPSESIAQPGAALAQKPATGGTTSQNATNYVEIYSDTLLFQLPATNSPGQTIESVTASSHVIISDPLKGSRASGDRAHYSEKTGLLELVGNAIWEGDQRTARADVLEFDRNSRNISARTNAYLRFPVTELAKSGMFNAKSSKSESVELTNQFVEVVCGSYDYRDGLVTFREKVNAALADADAIRGTLDCGTLTIAYSSNVVHSVLAETDVHAHQLPVTNLTAKVIERDLRCESLYAVMRTNGILREAIARENVVATQLQTPLSASNAASASPGKTNSLLPVLFTMTADQFTATFMPLTNSVDQLIADGHVVFTRNTESARGTKAVYTATNEVAVLSGNPVLQGRGGTSTPETVVWDRLHDKVFLLRPGGEVPIKVITQVKSKKGAGSAGLKTNTPPEAQP